jgi:hypothetical protein
VRVFAGPDGLLSHGFFVQRRPIGGADRLLEDPNRMFGILDIFAVIDLVWETNFLALEFGETE